MLNLQPYRKYVLVVLGACGLAGLGFVAGRYSAPQSQEKTLKDETSASNVTKSEVTKAKETATDTSKAKDVVTSETTIYKPNGTVVRRRTTHAVSSTNSKTSSVDLTVGKSESSTQIQTKLEEHTVTIYKRPEYAFEGTLLLKLKLELPTLDNFMLQAQKRVLGPAWLGAGYARINGENFGLVTLRFEF